MRRTTSVMLGAVLILLTLGIVMLTSTTNVLPITADKGPLFYLKRQSLWLAIAAVTGFSVARIDYHAWNKVAVPLAIFCAFLLLMTLIPNVGVSVKGSRRWLRFAMINLQPSEFAKPTVILLLAWWFARIGWHVKEFRKGMLYPIGVLGLIMGLIFVEPDYGTTMLIGVTGMSIMFVAGTRFIYLLVATLLGGTGFAFAVMHNELRWRRIIAFLDPERFADREAYQLLAARDAFVVGGATGVGFGQSIQKRYYLPEAHNDFIFAIIGEELGFVASGAVVLLFAVILVCGLRISAKAPDLQGRLAAFGITMMIVTQAIINVGVVTGCLPTKGLPLPFVSFGGSSLLATMIMIGILVNIALQCEDKPDADLDRFGDTELEL